MAFSGSQTTRMGFYGGPRGLYGSFAGKAATAATRYPIRNNPMAASVGRMMNR